jgi:transcriptional regulator with XRE-family HTH domain
LFASWHTYKDGSLRKIRARLLLTERERGKLVLLREELGEVLKEYRTKQKMTLRDVSTRSSVALGYISEIERGHKEASSEILFAITQALNLPLSQVLADAADRIALFETPVPDTIPDDFYQDR